MHEKILNETNARDLMNVEVDDVYDTLDDFKQELYTVINDEDISFS